MRSDYRDLFVKIPLSIGLAGALSGLAIAGGKQDMARSTLKDLTMCTVFEPAAQTIDAKMLGCLGLASVSQDNNGHTFATGDSFNLLTDYATQLKQTSNTFEWSMVGESAIVGLAAGFVIGAVARRRYLEGSV